jgi:hypothetical protein
MNSENLTGVPGWLLRLERRRCGHVGTGQLSGIALWGINAPRISGNASAAPFGPKILILGVYG